MSTYLIKQLRVGCVCFGGEIDEAGADALMALAADEIERRELCEKTSAEQLQSHSERLAEAGGREASLQELTRKLRKCLRAQTYQTSITAKSINKAVNEKLVWHDVVPEGLTLKEHPCEQNVGTCVNHLLDTIADLREETAMPDTLDAAARERLAAVTVNWPATNRRRGELIDRDIQDKLSMQDAVELERLQQLATLHIALMAPIDFTNLVEAEWQIRRGRIGSSWACPYCGEATRDKSTAAMHPALCEKWPYRLKAERLRNALLNIRAAYHNDCAVHVGAVLRIIDAAIEPEAALAPLNQKQPENTEGKS